MSREPSEEAEKPAQKRRRLPLALVASGALVIVFWLVASDAGWLMDAPFDYVTRSLYTKNLVVSVGRFLTPAESALSVVSALVLGPALVLAVLALARHDQRDPLELVAERALAAPRNVVLLLAFVACAGAAFVAEGLIGGTELIDDERAYAFQADLFAHFKASAPGLPAAFRNPTFIVDPVLTSKYPPGHALVLALGALCKCTWLVPPLLAGLLVVCVWLFVRDAFGPRQGLLAAALIAVSPMVWATHGTLMAFPTSTCAFAGFLAALAASFRSGKPLPALLAGAAIGLAFISRPFEAFALALPFALALVWQALRGAASGRQRVGVMLLGFCSVAWVLLWNNHAVLGSPWKFTWFESKDAFKLGFTQPYPWLHYRHTPIAALGNLLAVLARLEQWLFAWPGALALVLCGFLRPRPTLWDRLIRASLVSFALCYALVFGSGEWNTGPGYYYACSPLLVALCVRGLGWLRSVLEGALGRAASWLALCGPALAWLTLAPLHAASLVTLVRELEAPWDAIATSAIGDANVVVPPFEMRGAAGWGFGYPYRIATGEHTTAYLFEPYTRAELDAAVRVLGPRPTYTLALDVVGFQHSGRRAYAVVPFNPDTYFERAR